MGEPLLVIRNNHTRGCGEPPSSSNDDPGRYHGYFENSFGEQWVFLYDRSGNTGELRGGDAGWKNVFQVIDGRAAGLILGQEEAQWLMACWRAAAGDRS